MLKDALYSTVGVYRHVISDVVITVFALLGGLVGNYWDFLRLATVLHPSLVYGVYALACLALSFPAVLIFMILRAALKARSRGPRRRKLDIATLRLADGMIQEGIWRESQEHSLTVINDTGHDLKNCYVMLDEVAWKNFDGEWQVMAGDLFSEPFRWNSGDTADGKLDLDNGDRASFALISHSEYSIYNSTTKQNEPITDFQFVFDGGQFASIGYGSDIRLRITIRAKDEGGEALPLVRYLLYVHLLQQHGIPKVDVVRTERL